MTSVCNDECATIVAAGVREQSVCFRRHTGEDASPLLAGTLALPQAEPESRCDLGVVSVHGWAGSRIGPHRLFVRLGRELARRGVPALRFDLAGRGFSGGEAAAADLDGMIADTLAARRFLLKRVGCRRVAAVGICSGGNVAVGAATLEPMERLVLISTMPFTPRSGRAAWRKTFSYLKQYALKALAPDTWRRLARGEVHVGGVARTLAASAGESGEERRLKDSRRDIMGAFGHARIPSFFVYGGADPEAAPALDHFRAFCDEHDIPAEFLVLQEANHNFYARAWSRELEEAAVAFLLRDAGDGGGACSRCG